MNLKISNWVDILHMQCFVVVVVFKFVLKSGFANLLCEILENHSVVNRPYCALNI